MGHRLFVFKKFLRITILPVANSDFFCIFCQLHFRKEVENLKEKQKEKRKENEKEKVPKRKSKRKEKRKKKRKE
jgi:hypothetical protein